MKISISKFAKINFILFDFDGVLINRENTDAFENILQYQSLLSNSINYFHQNDYKIGIITARESDDVIDFLSELGFDELFTSSFDKVSPVHKMLKKYKLDFEHLLYVGDDILDIPLMQKVGISACPADAKREVRRNADLVLENIGGIKILAEIIQFIEDSKIELA